MALLLKTVAPSQGARWMRDGFRLFGRHPLAFSLMLVSFLFAALLVSMVPLLGPLVMLAGLPLMSLGFMVAAESALRGGPIHPGQFIQPLRGSAGRRTALLGLCLAYGAACLVAMLLSDWIDGGRFERLQRLFAQGGSGAEIEGLLADPRLAWGAFVRFSTIAVLSVPFWHAPALVHWGGQGWGQALFSSTLAVWRAKGAFVIYIVSWMGMVALFGAVTATLSALLSAREIAGILLLPSVLIFSTVFYVSLLFTFHDSFGGSTADVNAP
jgi:hypothetical protein